MALGPKGDLYAAGSFLMAGGMIVNRIAHWDGMQWNALGSGLDRRCSSIALAEDGALYVGGIFTKAGPNPVNTIARWSIEDPFGHCCPNSLHVINTPIVDGTYTASDTILCNKSILFNKNIQFQSGNIIQLEPGFEVFKGARFESQIGACN